MSALRRKAVVWIKTHFPDPMRNYMTGLLLGYLDTDFEEMNELYSSLGIIHLFALSGMQVGFFMDAFKKLLLQLGLTQEKLKWLTYPFSLIYAGLTGFSASVIRSLLQKLLAQHGVKGLDNFALTILVLFIIMPNFFLTAGGVLSCAYAFILTMTSKEGDGIKAVARESLVISLGILPILSFYFAEFQPWSILLTFVFSFLFDVVFLPLLSILFILSFVYPVTQFNFVFEWLEGVIRLVSQLASRPLVFGQPNAWLLILPVSYTHLDKGEAAYLNAPMTKQEFMDFHEALVNAEEAPLNSFEKEKYFEGCMPIEVMAKRGIKTMLYGPMKPVGLEYPDDYIGPRDGEFKTPYAVVQLRQDNAAGSLYNIVGFQTHLKWGEQKRVFQMIPGLSLIHI